MHNKTLKKFNIELPEQIVKAITEKEIISLLIDKALTKKEYYHSKLKIFENKYGLELDEFKKKNSLSDKEKFEEWDDLLLWEGYEKAYNEWYNKYEELISCTK
jgi:hypothetical protein